MAAITQDGKITDWLASRSCDHPTPISNHYESRDHSHQTNIGIVNFAAAPITLSRVIYAQDVRTAVAIVVQYAYGN
jgi:hypothetical protein